MNILRYTAIAAVLVSTLVSCGSSMESAADYVERGKVLLNEGKLEKARLEFKNAIQIDPRTAEAFYQLALLDEKSQKWKSMYANLTTTEQLNPSHHDAIVKLGQLYLLSGDVDKASEKAKKVLDIDGNHIAALILRASIEMKQQNFGSALKNVEKVLQLDNKNIEALSVKAMTYNQQGEQQQALQILEQALVIEPDNMALIMIKLSILESQKDYVAVEKVYRDLLLVKPEERWVVASLAKLLNFQNRYGDAKQVLQQFIEAQPEDRDAKLILVSLVQTREPEQAIILLESYVQQDENDFELQFVKIKLQLDNGQTEQALVGLQNIFDKDPEGNDGRKAEMVLANYEFIQGHYDAVQKKVDHVLSLAPEDESALILKSKINLLNNNIDAAVTDLRVVLRDNSASDTAMVLLGQAYLKSGSPELAEDNFRQALSVNPGNQIAALFIADKLIKSDDLERAESIILAALQDNPTDIRLLQVQANLKLQKQDWPAAKSISQTIRSESDNSAIASYLDGRILQGQQKYELAIEKYKSALSIEPTMSNALKGIAYSYFELGRKDDLVVFLKELIKEDPKYLNAYTVLYEIHASENNWDEAVLTLQLGLKEEPKWQDGYLLLATTHQRQGNGQGVIAAYERGLEALPESNVIALQLASSYERKGDFEKAKSLYEQVLERNPDVNVAINNLASLLSDQFRSEENLRKALAISKKFEKSSEPYFMDTYAWVNVQLGQLDKAQVILERVIAKSPDVAVFNYHLGAVYYKKADKASAEKYLKQAEMLAQKQGDENLVFEVNKLLGSL